MSQSKLTFQQIIDILKENNITVSKFAFEEWRTPPRSFELPEPYQSQRKAVNEFYSLPYEQRKNQTTPFYDYKAASKCWLESLGLGECEEIDQYGGEGQGDTWYSVKYFKDHDVYIRVNGWYQSYNGTEFYDGWDCCKEVKPISKTITVYE